VSGNWQLVSSCIIIFFSISGLPRGLIWLSGGLKQVHGFVMENLDDEFAGIGVDWV
jgi:hypothetical protein